jgi:predicted Zn-dependent peptidase
MIKSDIRTARLGNGLVILGEIIPHAHSATAAFFVRTGARDETKEESGVSHFLEHMVFKGTPRRSSLQLMYEFADIGAQSNAFTSEEMTVFHLSVIPENFGAAHEILSDMMRPVVDPAEYTTEKKVILEEIALYQDRPTFYLFETAFQDYFKGHSAGNSVLGSVDSITALTRDQMWAYHERRYAPNNMVLSAAGNFDWDEFVSNAEKYSGAWKSAETPRVVKDHRAVPSVQHYKRENLNRAHILFVTRGCSAQTEDRFSQALLSLILGDNNGSKMYWDLVHPGIAETASVDTDEKDGTGCLIAYGSCDPEKIEEVRAGILKILAKPLDFSEADLERVKKKLLSNVVLGSELPHGRAMSLGRSWLYRGKVVPLSETIEKIRAVSRKDIERVVAEYPLSNWCEYQLLPA